MPGHDVDAGADTPGRPEPATGTDGTPVRKVPAAPVPPWWPYARNPWRALLQLLSDVAAVLWAHRWAEAGTWTHDQVLAAADVGYQVGGRATGAADGLARAGDAASGVPLVGQDLAGPFSSAADAMTGLAAQGTGAGDAITWWATPAGLAVALLPVLLVLPWWLLLRARFVLRRHEAVMMSRHPDGLDLLALRALTVLPRRRLRPLGPGLVQRWRDGDPATVQALADLYRRRW